jgi:hypothetical protein
MRLINCLTRNDPPDTLRSNCRNCQKERLLQEVRGAARFGRVARARCRYSVSRRLHRSHQTPRGRISVRSIACSSVNRPRMRVWATLGGAFLWTWKAMTMTISDNPAAKRITVQIPTASEASDVMRQNQHVEKAPCGVRWASWPVSRHGTAPTSCPGERSYRRWPPETPSSSKVIDDRLKEALGRGAKDNRCPGCACRSPENRGTRLSARKIASSSSAWTLGGVHRPSCAARLRRNRHEIGRVAAYAGHVPAIQYTPTQHCCPCRLDCSIKNVFELGHYTGVLIRSFEPTRAR